MMMLNMWLIIMVMFIVGNMIFVSKHKHLLIVLLSLEFIVLSIFFMLMFLNFMNNDMYMLMIFLLFSVCEGALGLSILVSMIRTHGNDYFQSFNLL